MYIRLRMRRGCESGRASGRDAKNRARARARAGGCHRGKFQAVLSGESERNRARGRTDREKWKGIMGRDGSTRRSAENYDSSFSGARRVRVSRGTFDIRARAIHRQTPHRSRFRLAVRSLRVRSLQNP